MITIGIELNHVVRNVNRQLLKYYQKAVDPSLEIDDIEDDEDVLNKYIKFDSKKKKSSFIYEDYPYEIFGCANPMDTFLPSKINTWLYNITNIEDDDIRVVYYSLYEDALTIQSTYFFLSKIGTRVRKVIFPTSKEEVWDECDMVITSNVEMFDGKPEDKKVILITNKLNEDRKNESYLNYASLGDLIDDNNFFNTILNGKD